MSAVSLSLTDTKYISTSIISKELIWLKNMLNLKLINTKDIKLWIDNEPAVYVGKNPMLYSKMRQSSLHHHFMRY